ncbi:MAG: lysylphosphatidylglycerol synthase transmembrane domain-containing protein [Patescibacteria group bacterium]|jgi:hypothetical protein
MHLKKRLLKTLFFAAGLALGAGIFGVLIYRTGTHDVLVSLLAFGVVPLLGFIGISILNFGVYTFRWKLILDPMLAPEKRIPYYKMFLNRMSGFAAGYLTPAAQVAGEPIRVAMLHGDGVPVKVATSSVVLDLAFEITAFVTYVAMGIGFALVQGLGTGPGLYWSVLFISVLLVFMIGFFVATITGNGFFHHMLRVSRLSRYKAIASFEHWLIETEILMSEFFVGRTVRILVVIGLSLIMATFKAVEAIFIAHFFGVNIKITDALLMSTLPGVALLLPVPAGLGVYEGSNTALFDLLHLPINPVAYTIVIRLRDFLFIGIGVCYAVIRGEALFFKKYDGKS